MLVLIHYKNIQTGHIKKTHNPITQLWYNIWVSVKHLQYKSKCIYLPTSWTNIFMWMEYVNTIPPYLPIARNSYVNQSFSTCKLFYHHFNNFFRYVYKLFR